MKKLFRCAMIMMLPVLFANCSYSQSDKKQKVMDSIDKKNPVFSKTDSSPVNLSEEEWKKILPSDIYYISRQKGTERPWTSKFETSKEVGTYYCAVCGNALFKSDTKFESGCGWP
ncbi:MAG: peptide-methionine (R)-S-oxide reductase, partial [Gemmatimonadaceae bacterium]|nr:peptide-methionine (R)-S-oxide reductase [Chitinophagaceae bacterium]